MEIWGRGRTLGAVAIAALIAAGGGFAISAATGGGNHVGPGGMHGFGPPPAASAPHDRGGVPGSLHAVYVEADDGVFTTRMSQTGTVTAISPTSVTARSADGYTQTYLIRIAEGAAPPPFSVGDVLAIGATKKGEVATVDTMRPPLTSGH